MRAFGMSYLVQHGTTTECWGVFSSGFDDGANGVKYHRQDDHLIAAKHIGNFGKGGLESTLEFATLKRESRKEEVNGVEGNAGAKNAQTSVTEGE